MTSKSTNTKDELESIVHNLFIKAWLLGTGYDEDNEDETTKDDEIVQAKFVKKLEAYIAKDHQQLIQRFREEVIGADIEITEAFEDHISNHLTPTDMVKVVALVRQTQREILETMEKSDE